MCLPPISKGLVSARPAQAAVQQPPPPAERVLPKLAPLSFPLDAGVQDPSCNGEFSLSPFLKSPFNGLPFDFVFGPQATPAAPLQPFVPDMSDLIFSEFAQSSAASAATTTSPFPLSVPEGLISPQDSGFFSRSPSESASASASECFNLDDPDTAQQQKRRKRKHVHDLSAEELARMREVNRVAAQRHRQLAKAKQADQQRRLEAASRTNEDLHREVERCSGEVSTLKRLVFSMYGPGGPRSGALAHFVHLRHMGAC